MQIRSKTGFSAAIEHLESLIDSLKRGTIFISQRGKSILLKPSEPVDIELEAEIKPDDGICGEKLALKLKWEIRESWLREGEVLSLVPQSPSGQALGCFTVPYLFDQRDDDGGDAVFQGDTTAVIPKRKDAKHGAKRAKPGKRKRLRQG
jgi:amphi-Trp domain-containing protein